jgi:hypothetical protein
MPSTIVSVVYWSEFLAIDPEARVRLTAIKYFLSSSGFGTEPTHPREKNEELLERKSSGSGLEN